MKHVLTCILFLFTATLQAQVVVSEKSDNNQLTMGQVLKNKDCDKSTIKLLTEEISIQIHDGKEAYKTVQEVEYLIKTKGKKISKKRKVLNTRTENKCPEEEAASVFPDMTASVLSSVLSSKSIKKEDGSTMLPFTLTSNNDGTVAILIDKLAVMNSDHQAIHIQLMGADIQFVEITEKLYYKSSGQHLYLDSLNKIESVYSVISKEKSGIEHRVEVREEIFVKTMTK